MWDAMHAEFLTCLLLFYLVLHMLIPQPYGTRGLHTEKHFNFGCKVFCGQLIITHENFSVFLDNFSLFWKARYMIVMFLCYRLIEALMTTFKRRMRFQLLCFQVDMEELWPHNSSQSSCPVSDYIRSRIDKMSAT